MDIKNMLYLEKVHIKSDTNQINISSYGKIEKIIKINCDNDEKIKCVAYCDSEIISFCEKKFETNYNLKMYIDLSNLKINDEINTEIKIMSTYNDLKIPVNIKVMPPFLQVDKVKIKSLNDYYNYLKEDEHYALMLYKTEKFQKWIKSVNIKNIHLYNILNKDENIRRKVENFLCLTNTKDRVKIFFNNNIEKVYVPLNVEWFEHFIEIKKSGIGYFEYEIFIKNKYNFITYEQNKITSDNFKDSDTYKLKYTINTSKFIQCTEMLSFENSLEDCKLQFYKMPMCKITLEKYVYKKGDIGYLQIQNNFDYTLYVTINSYDVTFKNKYYKINDKQKILFEIEIDETIKKPTTVGTIFIEITSKNKKENKKLNFKIDLT